MKRRWISRVAATLAAIVLLVPVTGTAVAAAPVWERITCLSGGFDTVAVTANYDLLLAGHLDCGDSVGKARFGFGHYDDGPEPYIYWPYTHAYAAQAPSTFSDSKPVAAGTTGICLVTDYEVRIACVVATNTELGGKPTVAPISTKDPLVNRPTKLTEIPPRPACGTCW